MSAKAGTYWFWTDWLGDPAVRALTPAERGLWIDLLGIAAFGSPTGYVCDGKGSPISYEAIGRVVNASPTEVADLINGILEKGAASRDRAGRLFNRRMVRAVEIAAKKRRNGKIGGAHTKLKWLEFQAVPPRLPWQMPQQMPQHGKSSLTLKERKKDSFFYEAAPARAEPQQKGLSEGAEPSRTLQPSRTSRAALEQIYARRKGGSS